MATVSIYIDWGPDEDEDACWQDAVHLPLEPFRFDPNYAEKISEHVRRSLINLCAELEMFRVPPVISEADCG